MLISLITGLSHTPAGSLIMSGRAAPVLLEVLKPRHQRSERHRS